MAASPDPPRLIHPAAMMQSAASHAVEAGVAATWRTAARHDTSPDDTPATVVVTADDTDAAIDWIGRAIAPLVADSGTSGTTITFGTPSCP